MEQNDVCTDPEHYRSRNLDCDKQHYCYEYNVEYFGCREGKKCMYVHAEFPDKLFNEFKN